MFVVIQVIKSVKILTALDVSIVYFYTKRSILQVFKFQMSQKYFRKIINAMLDAVERADMIFQYQKVVLAMAYFKNVREFLGDQAQVLLTSHEETEV